jgi:hypothetical protein
MAGNKLKAWLLIVGVFLVAVGGAGYYLRSRDSFQSLTLTAPANTTVSIYPKLPSDESINYAAGELKLKTSGTIEGRLKKGSYVYVATARSQKTDYQQRIGVVDVGDQPLTIRVAALDYSAAKLLALSKQETPAAEAVIRSSYPAAMQNYSFAHERLYHSDEWFGAILAPSDPTKLDAYRIVLKKKDGVWQIVTNPPAIILSQPVYPDVPSDILSDLNNSSR